MMSVLTDYFAATPEEARACRERGPHGTALPHVELKGLDPSVLLGQLWANAVGAEYDIDEFDGVAEDEDDEAAVLEDESAGVYRIKNECTSALAAISGEQALPLAVKWSEAEEWFGRADPADLASIIRELREVARAATAPGRHLYLWMCV